MKEIITKGGVALGSFTLSGWSFFENLDFIGFLSGFAGASLTLAMMYHEVQKAEMQKEERRQLKIENDEREFQLQLQKASIGSTDN